MVVNVKTDAYDVYIGRPSVWGNPFKIGNHTRAEVVQLYREYIQQHPELREMAKHELRGKRLGCFCAPLPCHGDVLDEIANGR
jgi:hypothetical protein